MKNLYQCLLLGSLLTSALSGPLVAGTCPSTYVCPGISVVVNGQSIAASVTYTGSISNNVQSSFDAPVINTQTGEELDVFGAAESSGGTSIDQGITIRNLTSSLQAVGVTWDLPFTGGPYELGFVNLGETINAPTGFTVPYSVTVSAGSDPTGSSNNPFFSFSGTCRDSTGASSYIACGQQASSPIITTASSGYLVIQEEATLTPFEDFTIGGGAAISNVTAPEPATFALVAGFLGVAGLLRIKRSF